MVIVRFVEHIISYVSKYLVKVFSYLMVVYFVGNSKFLFSLSVKYISFFALINLFFEINDLLQSALLELSDRKYY